MNRLAGQAGRTIGGLLHWLGMFVITLFLVVAVLFGWLAYRLSQGPLQIPWITTVLANAVSGEDIDIDVGQAALGWSGYQKGGGAPLYLQLGRIIVHNAGGRAGGGDPGRQAGTDTQARFSAGERRHLRHQHRCKIRRRQCAGLDAGGDPSRPRLQAHRSQSMGDARRRRPWDRREWPGRSPAASFC